MAARLSVPYASIHGDLGLWLWDLWWTKRALVDLGKSPYFTTDIFFPTGTRLVFHNLSPYNGILGILLQYLGATLVTTYNLLYLSSFVLAGVGMFLLLRELTGNPLASFFGGAIYAFSPFHVVAYSWTNLWGTQWLPFALFFSIRLRRVGGAVNGVGLALALALATLSDWHQPLLLLLTIAVLMLSGAPAPCQPVRTRAGLCRLVLFSLLLYGILLSPIAYPLLRELMAGDTILKTPSWFHSFELLGYRVPWGDVISYGVLTGWLPVILAGYGMVCGLEFWTKRFLVLLIAFFILSLGEGLRLPGVAGSVVPLPFLVWRKIPLIGIIRGSIYFWVMAHVSLAVLAGHGVRKLWERMESSSLGGGIRVRRVLTSGLLAVALLEVLQAPLTPVPYRIHPVYQAILGDHSGRAILDAPIGYTIETTRVHAGFSMFLQTFHGHPLVGGYTQFDDKGRVRFLDANPVLGLFTDRWSPPPHDVGEPEILEPEGTLRTFLTEHHVGWVVARKGMRDSSCDEKRLSGWSWTKFAHLVAPAAVNPQLQALWGRQLYCGTWDAARAEKTEALLRRTLGPPQWDDAVLVGYRLP